MIQRARANEQRAQSIDFMLRKFEMRAYIFNGLIHSLSLSLYAVHVSALVQL